jgi:hypothetical protein
MCDYSLMAVPNRLAQEGEELVTYRFQTGSLGLASPADIKCAASTAPPSRGFWNNLKLFFNPPKHVPVPAVCIPPGARLRLEGVSARMQAEMGVGPVEDVTFTQISAATNTYRDAVRFSNGKQLRLQECREGLHVKVLDLSMAQDLDIEILRRELAEFVPR